MKLYNASLSPNALRVRAVARELGIELDIIDVDLRNGENKTSGYLAMNPNGKVPVFVDGDFVLWESRAINAYLAGLRPEHNLYPANPKQRAVVDQWSYWHAVHLGPTIQRMVFELFLKSWFGMGDPDQSAIEAQRKDLAQLLPILDANLAEREWVAGELSLADFAIASTFVYRTPAGMTLDEFPRITGWMDRVEARPSWQAAVAPVTALLARRSSS
jgi:glutathione S-transferase